MDKPPPPAKKKKNKEQQQQQRTQPTLDSFFSKSSNSRDAPLKNPSNNSSTVDSPPASSSTPREALKASRTETRTSPSPAKQQQQQQQRNQYDNKNQTGVAADMPRKNRQRRTDPQVIPLCTFFANGYCKYGNECRFSHASSAAAKPDHHHHHHPKHQQHRQRENTSNASPPFSYPEQRDKSAYVCMPWDSGNTFRGGAGQLCEVWPRVIRAMKEDGPDSSESLVSLLFALLMGEEQTSFDALRRVIDTQLNPSEKEQFFTETIPWMKCMVIHSQVLLESGVPLLLHRRESSVTLTELQVCALLCCGFFSLFPGRSYSRGVGQRRRQQGNSSHLAAFNFNTLFNTDGDATGGKIRCLLHYFQHQAPRFPPNSSASNPFFRPSTRETVLQYARVCAPRFPDFSDSGRKLLPIIAKSDGLIEECDGCLQVDFANRVVGGGVLRRGCVQEEIRFVICPELLISRLLCETLADNEAVLMSGCAQYSRYTGYASTFAFAGGNEIEHFNPEKHSMVEAPLSGTEAAEDSKEAFYACSIPSRDNPGARVTLPMANVCVVAMDAVDYNHGMNRAEDQFLASWVQREVCKAYVSFRGTPYGCLPSSFCGPIATGNWGCGAFGGDLHLKTIIQWCAASQVKRPLRYYTFGDEKLVKDIELLEAKLIAEEWTVGDLFTAVLLYSAKRSGGSDPESSSSSSTTEEEKDESTVTGKTDAAANHAGGDPHSAVETQQEEKPTSVVVDVDEANDGKEENEEIIPGGGGADVVTVVDVAVGDCKESEEVEDSAVIITPTETYDSPPLCLTSQDTVIDEEEEKTAPVPSLPYTPAKHSLFGFILSLTHRPTSTVR